MEEPVALGQNLGLPYNIGPHGGAIVKDLAEDAASGHFVVLKVPEEGGRPQVAGRAQGLEPVSYLAVTPGLLFDSLHRVVRTLIQLAHSHRTL